jgi:hypothetical protein
MAQPTLRKPTDDAEAAKYKIYQSVRPAKWQEGKGRRATCAILSAGKLFFWIYDLLRIRMANRS